MNQGNGYHSSPDQYMGNQMAPKREKFHELIWRKLRSKYEVQHFGDMLEMYVLTIPCYEPTFQCGRRNMTNFIVPIAKKSLLSILAKCLRCNLVAPPGDPGSNPAGLQNFFFKNLTFFHVFGVLISRAQLLQLLRDQIFEIQVKSCVLIRKITFYIQPECRMSTIWV